MADRNDQFPKKGRSQHFPILPPFMDGQLPSSFVHKILQFNRKTSLPLAYKHLIGHKKGLDGMQRGMSDLFEIVGHYYYDNVETLIYRHTEYYFYCCGLPREKHQSQFERLAGMLNGPTRLVRLPVLCAFSEGANLRCQECEESQLNDECGFTYDHRRMTSPFLMVCPIHGTKLTSSTEQLLLFDKSCQPTITRSQIRYSQELGARAAYCMEVPPEISGYHKEDVIEALTQAGRIGENGRLLMSETIADLQKFAQGKFADVRLDHFLQTPNYIDNALRALLRHDRGVHPIWCVIFKWFAEECPRVASPRLPTEERRRRPTVTPTHEELESQIKLHGTLTATATALDMNLNRVIALCNCYGISYTKRTKRIDAALDAAIQTEYDNGADPAEVAQRCGVSIATAYSRLRSRSDGLSPQLRKIRARTEKAKVAWMRLQTLHPNHSTTQLRRIATDIWTQLHRHDRQWLDSNSPVLRARCRHQKADAPQLLVEKLRLAAQKAKELCMSPHDRPIRQSRYRLQHLLGVSEYAIRKSKEFRQTAHPIEEYGDFVARRISWASKQDIQPSLKQWRLARLAGLRESTIERFTTEKKNATHTKPT